MDEEEAREWLEGKRSMTNLIPRGDEDTWYNRMVEADANMTKQAYYVLKAHNEGLLK